MEINLEKHKNFIPE